ncbi:hypothetical protein P692DRAFT_2082239 [Suillus brevipes Sb2]|nr:hypothetical protein P692DRAFT_2082239 [Suillus brevipes Sb2]
MVKYLEFAAISTPLVIRDPPSRLSRTEVRRRSSAMPWPERNGAWMSIEIQVSNSLYKSCKWLTLLFYAEGRRFASSRRQLLSCQYLSSISVLTLRAQCTYTR